jgi:Contractile injection system tube protein
MAEAGFVLINLINQDAFVFQFFPNEVRSNDRANWIAQETTIGVKPLFYGNREPRKIDVQDLYLDNTETNESLTDDLNRLRLLLEETEDRGAPPPLLAAWGDRQERCVLEDLTIDEVLFNTAGEPVRARIVLQLLQIQPDGESGGVRVVT